MRFEVKFYETTDGKKPVEDFLLSLENKMQAKMVQMMELLEEKGTDLREPYTKPLGDGIFEKTNKTPPKEIRLAKERRADYIQQQEDL